MPNRNFNELYDLILPYVPAVETPLVDYHIRRVVREFCRRTTLWRHRVTITTEPGVNDYLLSPYDATEGVIGGGGGGGGWVPASTAGVTVTTQITSEANGGTATVTYNPTTSIWAVRSEDEFANAFNTIAAYLQFSAPVRARLTLVPIYYQIGVNEWFEASGDAGLTRSTFNWILDGSVTGGVENTSGAPDDTLLTTFAPNPIVLFEVDGVTPRQVERIDFVQGFGFETGTTVAFSALVEVFQDAPAADPEICDPYSIISVVCDGKPIDPVPEDYRQPFGARPANARPKGWYSPSARVVHLYPTPDAAYTIVVDVVCALTMTPTNPVMPEFLFVDYREIIADGVIASLKILGNKPWFDPEGAVIYNRRYVNAVQGIRAKLRDANQPNVSTMRGPRFGR